jgi:hypothetical protein
LPTFAASSPSVTSQAGPDQGAIPDDCERLLATAELTALLGLPLDTVMVRSTVHVAAPSVGRTERVACRYSTKAAGPVRGRPLLDLNASAYVSPEAAQQQWRRNADIEDGVHRDLPDQPLPGNRPRTEALVDLALRVLPAVVPRTPPRPAAAPAPERPAAITPQVLRTPVPAPLAGGQ